MTKINILGNVFDSSGYSSHCRQLSNALFRINPNITLDTQKPNDWVRYVSDNELKMINNPSTEDATTIMISTPPTWRLSLADNPSKFFPFLIWEGSKIPKVWLQYMSDQRITGILVPSTHVKEAISNTLSIGSKTLLNKVHIVPHGVDNTLFKPIPNKREKIFTFVANKGWSQGLKDRGGVQYILSAFHKEFDKEEKVQIIAKINPVYNQPGWNLGNEMANIGVTGDNQTNIKINVDNVEFDKLPILYNRGHCFVSATRCDGFNLPGLEAMACGLSTIQTAYGGQTDYMTKDNSWYIDYKLEEVKHDINYEGSKWATPSILDLRKKMRYAFEHPDEVKKKGKQALIDSKNWTWDLSAKKLLKVISK